MQSRLNMFESVLILAKSLVEACHDVASQIFARKRAYLFCFPCQRWDARQDPGTWRITTLLLGLFFTLVLLIAVGSIVWRGVLTWRIIMQFVDVKIDEERLLHLASKSTWQFYFLAANLRGPIFFITKVKCPAHQDQGFVLGQLDVECVDSRELELQACSHL